MDLSIVVPVYNEELNVKSLLIEIDTVLDALKLKSEIIFINDGSFDKTYEELAKVFDNYSRLKIINFRKNFGQTSALVAGFDYALGEIIVAMDGDGQNDPKDIPKLIDKINEGYDLVSGWRKNRKDKFVSRRLPSMIANKIISLTTNVKLHDYGCSLKAFKKEVIKNIDLYGELHRFIPAIASWMGVQLSEIVVNHRPRLKGVSKYGISRTIKVILDLITVKFLLSFSTKPIQIFGFWGLISLGLGSILFTIVVYERFFMSIAAQRPLFTVSILLILAGFQFICLGLMAEIQVRIYHESTKKSIYTVKNVLQHKE